MAERNIDNMFQAKVLGHPAGLFVLFFTEMWERFSFYGMRVLLVNFLTMAVVQTNPGWEWSAENAGALYGTYAGLLYITPIAGGFLADKLMGYRWAVVTGALIMTLGHFCMALETEFALYAGLALLVIGTGFFKPNITSIISHMYKDTPQKKDGAFTIFYMGVNAGAFFGMMLCGYLAEKVGWSWGFGLAGIFMLFGLLQFALAKPLFGDIGAPPEKGKTASDMIGSDETIDNVEKTAEDVPGKDDMDKEKPNPFTLLDKILTAISAAMGLIYLFDDPLSKIAGTKLIPEFLAVKSGDEVVLSAPIVFVLIALVLFLFLTIGRILRYSKLVRNRMFAVIIFAFFTVFFWMSFEQGASSLVLFARDFTDRTLDGSAAVIYKIINLLLTIVPLVIISWVLFRLFRETWNQIRTSNIILGLSFVGVWAVAIWMLNRDMNTKTYEVKYSAIESVMTDDDGNPVLDEKSGDPVLVYTPVDENYVDNPDDVIVEQTGTVSELIALQTNQEIQVRNEGGAIKYLTEEDQNKIRSQVEDKNVAISVEDLAVSSEIYTATVVALKDSSEVEITVSWFSILNSFFIIAFASFFSKWWESKYNVPAAFKYGLGLVIMAIGFGLLAYGSGVIPKGAEAGFVRVSMIWLVLAYLFHTLGELCLSPMGLSYVSKLVPGRMIAFMFGMWYLAIAIGNKVAGSLGGMIEEITSEYSMSTFFLIFTIVPAVAGIIIMILHPLLKKLMGGID